MKHYNWGERSEPHTCGENGKLSIYIFIYIYIYIYLFIYIYIYGTCVFRIYTSCPICARCNISTLHVSSCNHCCSREKTSRTERLNSAWEATYRNLKTVRKGRHYYQHWKKCLVFYFFPHMKPVLKLRVKVSLIVSVIET